MRRIHPGAFGRIGSRRLALVAVAALLLAACGPNAPATFSLAIRNSGDAPVRLRVIVDAGAPPQQDYLVPGHSAVLRTAAAPLHVGENGNKSPVTIEIYTETCALLNTIQVGEGLTRLDFGADFAVTAIQPSGDPSSGGVEPDTLARC